MFRASLSTLAILPANLLLRRILNPALLPLLNLLLVLFLVDQVRAIIGPELVLSRLLFDLEMLVTLALLFWVVPPFRKVAGGWWLERMGVGFGLLLALVVLVSLAGFVELAHLVGDATLATAYLALFLYAFLQIVSGFFVLALRLPPLNLLRSVQQHRRDWRRVFMRICRFVAIALCAAAYAARLGLLDEIVRQARWLGAAGITFGELDITVGGVVTFFVAVWLAVHLSRFCRFLLQVDVYPRTHLGSGVSYTLSTLVHYVILIGGVLFGLASVGIDLTQFVVVAGAMSVGIGLGLQDVFKNFVSGLILLFERPVEVGDVIEVSGQQGRLRSIGLRASAVGTAEGAEVLIPNGTILSGQLTNWSTLGTQRRMVFEIVLGYQADPDELKRVVLTAVQAQSGVAPEPPAQVLCQALAENSSEYQVRAWTPEGDDWTVVRAELLVALHRALSQAAAGAVQIKVVKSSNPDL